MAAVVPLRKKKTQNPRRTFHRNPNETDDEDQTFPIYFLIMIPNTIGMFARAHRRSDYSLAVLGLLLLLSLALYDCCWPLFLSIPKSEKSSRKLWLKFVMWVLYTSLSFGFVFEFGYFLNLQMTVGLYGVVLVCSVVLLYELVIADFVEEWKSRKSGEHGIANRRLDAGEVEDSDSVLDRV
ncbi:hypothetical protein LXL04_006227 [Taraxacum kok-saghyz]